MTNVKTLGNTTNKPDYTVDHTHEHQQTKTYSEPHGVKKTKVRKHQQTTLYKSHGMTRQIIQWIPQRE